MIIACPACATRYVVPDSAIGAEGRTVRCAKCRHSWFQDGPDVDLPHPADRSPPADQAASRPAPGPATASPAPAPEREDARGADAPVAAGAGLAQAIDPLAEREVAASAVPESHRDEEIAEPAPPPPDIDQTPEPPTVVEVSHARDSHQEDYGDEISQFDYAPPFRPRRNMMKVWTAAAALFAVIALGTVGAVSYWGLPDWVPISRPTFAMGQADLVLDFPRERQERRTLPNGTEYFGASGTVKNVGRESRAIPSILIVLRDARERIVYSWEIAPPKPRLAPGETVTINEAVTDVPRSARIAEIGWKPN
ncbi:thioredoxin [Altererythrobacter aerius]|uniref:Thioredoxin n=1 Tax=Tsuneonella aeria TaxID=1837929 RepID=A0A6I4THZ8_9SPHN|nr:zinc-ribbon domain-containing protein [Tsuneonella aeria]MXO75690.1 thioredoxin [Tsuneonella aeria]